MKNENKLTNIQFASLIITPILGLFSGIGTHNLIKISKVDSTISILLAFFISLIPLSIFLLIFNYKKELSLKEKLKYLFGNILGNIINYLIIGLILITGVISFYGLSNFTISQLLTETPYPIFMLVLSIVLIYGASQGIENIARVNIIFIGIIIALTIFSTIGKISHFEMSNIKPLLSEGIMPPLKGSIVLNLTNVIPIFILLAVPKDKIHNNKKTTKYLFIFHTLSFILIFITMILTIGALGIYLCQLYQYPEYTALKKISFFNFIDRIENLIYVKWVLSNITYLTLIVFFISNSIKKESKIILPSITCILLTIISIKIFKNNTIFYNFVLNTYPYISILLFSIFIIISINIIIRKITKLDNLSKHPPA